MNQEYIVFHSTVSPYPPVYACFELHGDAEEIYTLWRDAQDAESWFANYYVTEDVDSVRVNCPKGPQTHQELFTF